MNRKLLLLAGALSGMAVTASAQTVRSYVTLPDRSALYSESEEYEFSDVRDDRGGRSSYIVIDPRQSFQPVDGFGFALTAVAPRCSCECRPKPVQRLSATYSIQ